MTHNDPWSNSGKDFHNSKEERHDTPTCTTDRPHGSSNSLVQTLKMNRSSATSFEQYQRGRGSIWYWRQVLVDCLRGALSRSSKETSGISWWDFSTPGAFGEGCNSRQAVVLMMRYVLLHPEQFEHGTAVQSGFPLLTLRIWNDSSRHADQWISVYYRVPEYLDAAPSWTIIAPRLRIHPRELLLAFITSFVVGMSDRSIESRDDCP